MQYFPMDPTILILIPALLLGMWAQSAVNSRYRQYSQVLSQRNISAYDAARMILQGAGAYNVGIEMAKGSGLSDHFDPKANVLRLSQGVMHSTSIAAIGIAAHEAGHALQYQQGYFPIRIRSMLIPACSIGSNLAWPLFFVGILMASDLLLGIGIALYLVAVLFQLITLPVEFNASRRAIQILQGSGILSPAEIPGVRKVLSAAAMTYVAATVNAAANLLRMFTLANRRRS